MTDTGSLDISLNSEARIDIKRIGNEGSAVFIVDNALSHPEVLVEYAMTVAEFGAPPENSRYPGLVATLPDAYRDTVLGALRAPMVELFNMNPDFRFASYGFFGLATVPHERMAARQAAPHIDSHKMASFASVHYLSGAQFGGTSFYRHKATGFEVITPIRSDKFRHVRQEELAQRDGQPVAAVEAFYEEIAYVEPVFNRLVFYRAGQLHCARMTNETGLTSDPRNGRLTANLFANTD